MTTTQTTLRTDVLVIGAGQAGLAAGYHLQRQGIDARIVEADARVGDVWRRRYDSLKLYSPAGYASLPGMPFPLPKREFPTGHEMADYLETYAGSFGLTVDTGVRIERLEAPDGDGRPFVATAGDRRYEAGQVIVATGAFQHPRVPAFATELDPGIRQLHSSAYRNPVAARRWSRPGRRAEPLGRRPRPRDRRDPPGDRVGQVARADPGSA